MSNLDIIFKETFRALYPSMLFYSTRIVGDKEAEDVVQEAFVELWKRKEELSDGEHAKAFLFRAIYTRSLNVLKHRDVTQNYAESMKQIEMERATFYQPENNETIKRMENKELREQIRNAIDELPDKCRQVFIMSYLHDMKNKEIADVLDISVKTVEVHIYKALKFLRGRLDYLVFVLIIFSIH
jgi:RNA polymerase sigma-70 factor (ECF subfamily)